MSKYADIELVSKSSWGWELEGGYDIEREIFEEGVKELGIYPGEDCSAEVYDRLYDKIELKVDGFWLDDNCIQKTEKLIDFLDKDTGWGSSEECGIHIHVGNEYNSSILLKVLRLFYKIEGVVFDGILPEYRQSNNHWMQLRGSSYLRNYLDKVEGLSSQEVDNARDLSFYADFMDEQPRKNYCLNIGSVFYRGTIEFRMFDSNHIKLPHYLDFVDKFMYLIKNNNCETLDRLADLINEQDGIYDKLHTLCELFELAESTKEVFLAMCKEKPERRDSSLIAA